MLLKNPLIYTAQAYNRKIFPYLESIRGAHFISRSLENLAFKAVKQDTLEVNQVRMVVDSELIGEDIAKQLVSGNYEKEEYRMVQKYIQDREDVIELGGGLGYIACVIDSIVSDETSHIVLEPHTQAVQVLKDNKELNKAEFSLEQKAYCPEDKDIELQLGEQFWSSSTVYEKPEGSIYTEGISLHKLISEFSIDDFTAVVDIEGAEYKMIEKEISLLSERCRRLIVEFHNIEEDTQLYEDSVIRLTENGFKLVEDINNICVFENRNF